MRLSRTKAGGILICGKIKPRMSPSWQPSPSCLPGVSKFRQEPTLQPGLEGSRSPVHTKPRNPGRGWKHETRLGWDVIQKFPPWTTAAFPCWGAMRQRGTHSSESSPRGWGGRGGEGGRGRGSWGIYTPVPTSPWLRAAPWGRWLSGPPVLPCSGQGGARGQGTPSGTKDIRPACPEVGGSADMGGHQ